MLKTTTFCFVLISCALLTFGYEKRDIPTTSTVVSNPFEIISCCSPNPITNSQTKNPNFHELELDNLFVIIFT